MPEEPYIFTLSRDEFHEPMGGGLPRGSIITLEGPNASGKSVISQRLIYGLLFNNNTVSYISTELTTKGLISQMYSLDYSIAKHLLNESLLFIPVFPLVGKMKVKMDYVERLMKNGQRIFDKDVIFIDCFSSLIKDYPKPVDTVARFFSFIKKISALGKTVILTLDPDTTDPAARAYMVSSADCHFALKVNTIGGYVSRTVRLQRMMKATRPFEETIGYRIEPGVGLIVEITAYG